MRPAQLSESETAMPKFVLQLDGRSHEIPLIGDNMVFGRGGDCDVPMAVEGMSRQHFRVFKRGLVYYIEDLGSRNGTRYESEMLGRSPKPLVHGARVLAGAAVLIYRDSSALKGSLDQDDARFRSSEQPTAMRAPGQDDESDRPTATHPPKPVAKPGKAPHAPAETGTAKESAPAAMAAWVEFKTESAGEQRRVELKPGESLTIGRADDNLLVLHDPMVSSYHAVIAPEEDGHAIQDLGTRNGTFYGRDRERVEAAELRDGDVLLIARAVLLVYRNPALAEQDLPEPNVLPWMEDEAEVQPGDSAQPSGAQESADTAEAAPATNAAPETDDDVWIEVQTEANAEPNRYPLAEGLSFGRADDNDVVLHDPMISSHHCVIEREEDGAHYLRDLGTSNGTFVGRTRERLELAEMREGEVYWAAKAVRLTYHHPAQAVQDLPEPHVQLAAVQEPKPEAASKDAADKPGPKLPGPRAKGLAGKAPAKDFKLPSKPGAKDAAGKSSAKDGPSAKAKDGKPRTIVVRDGPSWKGVFGLILFAAAVLGGSAWLVAPTLIQVNREGKEESRRTVAMHAENALLSFEREGQLGGWRVDEVMQGVVHAGIDQVNFIKQDKGRQSLLLASAPDQQGVVPAFALVSEEPQRLEYPGTVTLSGWMAGTTKSAVRLRIDAIGPGGEQIAIGQTLLRPNQDDWSNFRLELKIPRRVNNWASAPLRMVFEGEVEALWLDAMEIRQLTEEEAPTLAIFGSGSGDIDSPRSEMRVGTNADAVYNSGTGWSGTFRALVVDEPRTIQPRRDRDAFEVRDVNAPIWVFRDSEASAKSFSTVWQLPRDRTSEREERRPNLILRGGYDYPDMTPETLQLDAAFHQCAGALEFESQLGTHDDVWVVDEIGNGVAITQAIAEDQWISLGPVAEISVGGIALYFPLGNRAAVQIIEYQPGAAIRLRLTPAGRSGESVRVWVANQPRTPLQVYQRVHQQMHAMHNAGFESAALERAHFLARLDTFSYANLVREGKDMIARIDSRLESLWTAADEAMKRAREESNETRASYARRTYSEIAEQYPGDVDADKAQRMVREASKLIRQIRGGETVDSSDPEEDEGADQVKGARYGGAWRGKKPEPPQDRDSLRNLEANAADLLALAQEYYANDNWTMAFAFADNVAWNYHYTAAAQEAIELRDTIAAAWTNASERDAWVGEQMQLATQAENSFNTQRARELYLAILRRYPNCPEKLRILKRLRSIEARAKAE